MQLQLLFYRRTRGLPDVTTQQQQQQRQWSSIGTATTAVPFVRGKLSITHKGDDIFVWALVYLSLLMSQAKVSTCLWMCWTQTILEWSVLIFSYNFYISYLNNHKEPGPLAQQVTGRTRKSWLLRSMHGSIFEGASPSNDSVLLGPLYKRFDSTSCTFWRSRLLRVHGRNLSKWRQTLYTKNRSSLEQ